MTHDLTQRPLKECRYKAWPVFLYSLPNFSVHSHPTPWGFIGAPVRHVFIGKLPDWVGLSLKTVQSTIVQKNEQKFSTLLSYWITNLENRDQSLDTWALPEDFLRDTPFHRFGNECNFLTTCRGF